MYVCSFESIVWSGGFPEDANESWEPVDATWSCQFVVALWNFLNNVFSYPVSRWDILDYTVGISNETGGRKGAFQYGYTTTIILLYSVLIEFGIFVSIQMYKYD